MMQGLIMIAERPWVSLVVGTAISIFSILLSIILYRRSLVRNSLSYVKVEVEILSVAHPTWETNLDIKYQGVQITRLTAGRIGIWNSGNTTINYSQVVQSEPLIVTVPKEARLLACEAYAASRPVLNVRVDQLENNQATIKFDYLDPGDGFMLHIAQSSPRNTLNVEGTIKGLPNGLTMFSVNGGWPTTIARSSLLPVVIMTLGVAASSVMARAISSYFNFKVGEWQYNTISLVLFFASMVLAGLSIFTDKLVQKRRSASIPKSIRTDPVIASTLGLRSK